MKIKQRPKSKITSKVLDNIATSIPIKKQKIKKLNTPVISTKKVDLHEFDATVAIHKKIMKRGVKIKPPEKDGGASYLLYIKEHYPQRYRLLTAHKEPTK